MKSLIKCLVLSAFFMLSSNLMCQNEATNSGGEVVTVQPKIMVVVKTLEGEDIREVLEGNVNNRTTATKLKEAFDKRGFTTVDFTAKLKSAQASGNLSLSDQKNLKSEVIRLSGADIFVEFEIIYLPEDKGSKVRIDLTAFESSTGNSLANKNGDSPRIYTKDFGLLAGKAIEKIADEFLNVLQTKFNAIVENGRSVNIIFSFDQDSKYTMESEIGEDQLPLADVIEIWMEENAFKNNYNLQSSSELLLEFDDVKIPLKNQQTGKNYNPNKFALEIWKFLKKNGLQPSKTVTQSKILITIK